MSFPTWFYSTAADHALLLPMKAEGQSAVALMSELVMTEFLQRILSCSGYGEYYLHSDDQWDLIQHLSTQRTFLREITTNKTLQIQAIGLSLYEPVDGVTEDKIGEQVIRTQWL